MRCSTIDAVILIGVQYEEFKPDMYSGILVSIPSLKSNRLFIGDNPARDWKEAQDWIAQNFPVQIVLNRSSVDNFVLDGGTLDLPAE